MDLKELIWDRINNMDEEFKKKNKIDKLDNEDVNNIRIEITNSRVLQDLIRNEIEYYAEMKSNM